MNAFTRSTLAAAQAELRRCLRELELVRVGGCELSMLAHHVHLAQLRAEAAEREIDRAVRLDEEQDNAPPSAA